MSKVYITEGSDVDATVTFGVWSSLELAKADLLERGNKDISRQRDFYWTYTITEWDVDGKKKHWWRLEYDERGHEHDYKVRLRWVEDVIISDV